jgi:hypothetical protein
MKPVLPVSRFGTIRLLLRRCGGGLSAPGCGRNPGGPESPAAVIGDVSVALGKGPRIEDRRHDAAIVETDRARVQTGRLARLDPTRFGLRTGR